MSHETALIIVLFSFLGLAIIWVLFDTAATYGFWALCKCIAAPFVFFAIIGTVWMVAVGLFTDLDRPTDEPAYGWYEYAITSADTADKAYDYDCGLLFAEFRGDITATEYDTLHELAERTFDALLEQEKEAEE